MSMMAMLFKYTLKNMTTLKFKEVENFTQYILMFYTTFAQLTSACIITTPAILYILGL